MLKILLKETSRPPKMKNQRKKGIKNYKAFQDVVNVYTVSI